MRPCVDECQRVAEARIKGGVVAAENPHLREGGCIACGTGGTSSQGVSRGAMLLIRAAVVEILSNLGVPAHEFIN